MGVTNRLVYDPTDANTIASSSTVGAYLLACDDGSPIGSTSNALDVNIGAVSDLDIRDLTQTDEITAYQGGTWTITSITNDVNVTQGTDPCVIGDGGGSITVDASQLDIDDLNATDDQVGAYLFDGAGTALTSTLVGADQALDVNVVNDIDVDDGIANTAIENTATAVSTSIVACVSSALANRKYVALANEGNKSLYVGKNSGLTSSNGFPLHPGMQHVWRVGPSVNISAIGRTGASSEDMRVMELS